MEGGGDPVTLAPTGFLHRLAYTTLFRRVLTSSCAAWTPAQAVSHLITALSSFLDNMVRILQQSMVKTYLDEYSISLLGNKSSALYNISVDKDTHSHLI